MRVGIVGTGRMAAARVECIEKSPTAELAWVCSRSLERGKAFLSTNANLYTGLNDAFAAEEAEAVIITTPNACHYDEAAMAFDRDLDVFLEYPLAVTPEQGEKLIELAIQKNRVFHVGLTHLHGGRHKAIAELCGEGGALGKPLVYQHIYASGQPISRWYDTESLSGGMFVSSLYHYIDEAMDFFGEPVGQSSAYSDKRTKDGTILYDSGSIQMVFSSGCTAQLAYARGMKKPGTGTRRTWIFENGYLLEDDDGLFILTPEGRQPLSYVDVDALQAESDAFFAAVGSRDGVDSSVYHSQRTLVVAHKAAQEATYQPTSRNQRS